MMNTHSISIEAVIKIRNLLAVSQNETVEFEFTEENNCFYIRNKDHQDKRILLGQRPILIPRISPEPMNPLYSLVESVFDEANEMFGQTVQQRNYFILQKLSELTSTLDLNQEYE